MLFDPNDITDKTDGSVEHPRSRTQQRRLCRGVASPTNKSYVTGFRKVTAIALKHKHQLELNGLHPGLGVRERTVITTYSGWRTAPKS